MITSLSAGVGTLLLVGGGIQLVANLNLSGGPDGTRFGGSGIFVLAFEKHGLKYALAVAGASAAITAAAYVIDKRNTNVVTSSDLKKLKSSLNLAKRELARNLFILDQYDFKKNSLDGSF